MAYYIEWIEIVIEYSKKWLTNYFVMLVSVPTISIYLTTI